MISDSLSYPFRGGGIFIMITGTITAMILQFATIVPLIGLLALVLFYGYFTAYYYQILQRTATGGDQEPEWPDLSEFFDDMIRPVFQVLGVLIISNLLWLLALWQFGEGSIVTLIAEGIGMFYFPMAILGVVILGHIGGANPILIIPSIMRSFSAYALVAAIAIALPFALNALLNLTQGTPFIGWGVSTLFGLYFITVHARLLGLFYRKNEAKLDWL